MKVPEPGDAPPCLTTLSRDCGHNVNARERAFPVIMRHGRGALAKPELRKQRIFFRLRNVGAISQYDQEKFITVLCLLWLHIELNASLKHVGMRDWDACCNQL